MSNDLSSHASVQFKQLPMFMTAREIRGQYRASSADRHSVSYETDDGPSLMGPSVDVRPENDHELFNRKYNEASSKYGHTPNDARSLKQSILEDGVNSPVSLQAASDRPQIMGGHHRIAVMSKHKPDTLIPVEHFSDGYEAKRSLGDKF